MAENVGNGGGLPLVETWMVSRTQSVTGPHLAPWTHRKVCRAGLGRLPLQKREQDGDLPVAQAQVGHLHVSISGKEGGGDRVVLGQHLVGGPQVTHEPAALAPRRYTRQVGPHRVALPDGVTGTASALNDERAGLGRREG